MFNKILKKKKSSIFNKILSQAVLKRGKQARNIETLKLQSNCGFIRLLSELVLLASYCTENKGTNDESYLNWHSYSKFQTFDFPLQFNFAYCSCWIARGHTRHTHQFELCLLLLQNPFH